MVYFHLQNVFSSCVCVCTQLYLSLCDPMDCSPPGFSVHGIFQGRVLEWVAISYSRDLPDPETKLVTRALAGGFFTASATCMNVVKLGTQWVTAAPTGQVLYCSQALSHLEMMKQKEVSIQPAIDVQLVDSQTQEKCPWFASWCLKDATNLKIPEGKMS